MANIWELGKFKLRAAILQTIALLFSKQGWSGENLTVRRQPTNSFVGGTKRPQPTNLFVEKKNVTKITKPQPLLTHQLPLQSL